MPNIKLRQVREGLGMIAGFSIAPVFGAGSLIRRGRIFHPSGICFKAEVQAAARAEARFEQVAHNLTGTALMRFSSSAWRKEHIFPDLLGCAIRFGISSWNRQSLNEEGRQDVLMITARRLWTLPFALLTTD
jgi:hypothetical protein